MGEEARRGYNRVAIVSEIEVGWDGGEWGVPRYLKYTPDIASLKWYYAALPE